LSGYITYLKQSKRGGDTPGSLIREIESPYLPDPGLEPEICNDPETIPCDGVGKLRLAVETAAKLTKPASQVGS
jgi:hypothetical protein